MPASNPGNSIIVEEARDRVFDFYERELTPREVKEILSTGADGFSDQWEGLYKAMFDTWPRLQKNITEVARAVRNAPWKCRPYAELGDEPTPQAVELAKAAERMLWSTRPSVTRDEKSFQKLIEALTFQNYTGLGVHETDWYFHQGEWRPRAFRELPARYYGYPYQADGPDRLMLRPDGHYGSDFTDFPPHRFIIAINGGHAGHPSMSAPLRVLTAYWLASVFGWKWFMQFAQLYGIPFRWATYAADDNATKSAVAKMMKSIGAAGWGIGPKDTTLNTLESSKSGNALPQGELVKMADEQCDIFILGQTLTSSVGDSGSRALGDVHASVRHDVIKGVSDFVGEIISTQLIPAWAFFKFGRVPDYLPDYYPVWPEPVDEKANAETLDIIVNKLKVPLSESYVYEKLGVPIPGSADKLFQSTADPTAADASAGALPQEVRARLEASDWSGFAEHHGGLGIPRAEMPQIRSSARPAMVRYLKARGIESRAESVLPATLKATQAEFSQEKVDAARDYIGGNRAILVSQDDHIVDGHHQWLAALQDAPKERIRIIRLMAPIRYVLEQVKAMPSSTLEAADHPETIAEALKRVRLNQTNSIAEELEAAMKEGLKTGKADA